MVSWFRQHDRDDSFARVSDDTPTGELPVLNAQGIPITEFSAKYETAKYETAKYGQVTLPEKNSELERALSDREALIRLCLYALDRARSNGVVQRIEQGLAEIGVIAIRPDGALFDPSEHEAGGTVMTDDVKLQGVVAETEVPGFIDRDRLLRAPIVTVYTPR